LQKIDFLVCFGVSDSPVRYVNYKRFAFVPETMLARRMYPILKDGIFGPWNMQEADNAIREWNELHPEDGVAVSLDEFGSDSELSESDSDGPSNDAQERGDGLLNKQALP
jgi:hypothetical protein